MPNRILVILGHPDQKSYNRALFDAYVEGAKSTGNDVRTVVIQELDFNINLQYGYRKRTELEPDLLLAQESLKWADHIVWIYPVWWGSYPAIMKGFIDRVLLPGFAFQKREGSLFWDRLLKGKSARFICTMDQPAWFYRWINRAPSTHAMKRLTMDFIGVRKVKTTAIGPVRLSTDAFRQKWIEKVEEMGRKGA